MHSPKLPVALLIPLAAQSACFDINWERSVYEGVRRGADNAAQRPESVSGQQTTRLPACAQFERDRQRLMTRDSAATKAASPQ